MYFSLSYITIDRHVSVASATIVRMAYKITINIKLSAKNVHLKPPDFVFCVFIFTLLVFLYDILMMFAEATEICL